MNVPMPRPSVRAPRREAMRIAGRKVEGDDEIEVRHPFDGSLVGSVPKAAVSQVREAFQQAHAYRAKLSRHERSRILRRTAELLASRREEIATLISLECGISLKDSTYEVGRACDVFELSATLVLLDDAETYACDITAQGKKRRIFTLREPLGAISAITPFNHPLNQVAHKVAPSIATNNCMVLKPTEKTPLTALLLADTLYEAGLPPEMFSVVTGDPAQIADEMILNPHAELITFTGGVRVGKYIAAKAGYRRMVLELGGNDPLIVMEDADLDRAAELAAQGSYRNSGQRCTAVKRILVQRSVADAFVERLVAKSRKITCGDPLDPASDIGTVINEQSARLFEARVDDAVAKGARLLLGNE
ncbi:MAG: aldehyde dehydrogenase family protein, partial [Alphaproteobacteria bacterium]|nr:aldehyde dehydrogenase family protein [Alphaproteobacteria bacterium]